jgi:hypothetical protein
MLRKHTCPDELAKGWSRFVKEKGLHTGAREGVWRDALGREAATGIRRTFRGSDENADFAS